MIDSQKKRISSVVLLQIRPMSQQFLEAKFLEKVGQKLTIARIEAGYKTKSAAANAIPCDRSQLTLLENGKRRISISDLAQYALFYGKDINFFIDFDLGEFIR